MNAHRAWQTMLAASHDLTGCIAQCVVTLSAPHDGRRNTAQLALQDAAANLADALQEGLAHEPRLTPHAHTLNALAGTLRRWRCVDAEAANEEAALRADFLRSASAALADGARLEDLALEVRRQRLTTAFAADDALYA
jgi:hypothetical protein